MRMSVALRAWAASEISRHCCSDSCPVSRFWEGTREALDKSRVTSCSLDISSEKMATVFFRFMAA